MHGHHCKAKAPDGFYSAESPQLQAEILELLMRPDSGFEARVRAALTGAPPPPPSALPSGAASSGCGPPAPWAPNTCICVGPTCIHNDRLNLWWNQAGTGTDFAQPGKAYYGDVTLHEVLERTAWHSGQHTRQLMLTLESIGIRPDQPLDTADFRGLPMPKEIWDNEKTWR